MVRGRRPPSQGKTFLRNHADGVASIDLFVVPTISFRLLYGLLILHHGRREILWIGTTAQPNAEWIARQLTEAFGWEETPRYIIRAYKRFGRIDVLVNNAGVMPLSFVEELRIDEWNQMIDVNLRGVLHGIAAVLPIMREQRVGHIINVASVSAHRVDPKLIGAQLLSGAARLIG